MLQDVKISKDFIVTNKDSLNGSQTKYYKDNVWYKVDRLGNEGSVESLVSIVLKHSNIYNYVEYKECTIDNRPGCMSHSFLNCGEEFLSLNRLHCSYYGIDLHCKLHFFNNVKEKFDYLVYFCKEVTGLDITTYLANVLVLDMLIVNIDRHLDNLGVIACNGYYREAPIFDNGQALLQNSSVYYPYENYEERLDKSVSATISGSFENQYIACREYVTLKLNYNSLIEELKTLPKTLELEFLLKQLSLYKRIFNNSIK